MTQQKEKQFTTPGNPDSHTELGEDMELDLFCTLRYEPKWQPEHREGFFSPCTSDLFALGKHGRLQQLSL